MYITVSEWKSLAKHTTLYGFCQLLETFYLGILPFLLHLTCIPWTVTTSLHDHHCILIGFKQGRPERLLPIFILLLAVNSLHPTLPFKQSPFTYRNECFRLIFTNNHVIACKMWHCIERKPWNWNSTAKIGHVRINTLIRETTVIHSAPKENIHLFSNSLFSVKSKSFNLTSQKGGTAFFLKMTDF